MLFVLRIVHVVAGVFWVGSVMFATLLLAPSLKAVGPGAGPVMNELIKVRKMPVVMMISSILTVVAGLWLFMIRAAGQPGVFMSSGAGMTYAIGGAMAVLGFTIGMAVNLPTTKRLGAIGSGVAARGGPPTAEEQAEMKRLQGRLSTASQVVMGFLVLATVAMAIGRYVP